MTHYDRREQLSELITAIKKLIVALEIDPRCIWLNHFKNKLKEARYLFENVFSQDDINALSK